MEIEIEMEMEMEMEMEPAADRALLAQASG